MNMEVINKIETKISELENRAKKTNEFLGNIIINLKSLRKEKVKAQDEINTLAGALEAFKGTLSELKLVPEVEKEKALEEAPKSPKEKK